VQLIHGILLFKIIFGQSCLNSLLVLHEAVREVIQTFAKAFPAEVKVARKSVKSKP
jgi:hypothetical protein